MDKEPAFQALCHASAELVPYLLVRPDGGEFKITRPLQCSDWEYFKQTQYWGLRDATVRCSDGSPQNAVVNLLNDRVVRVRVFCTPAARNDR